MHSFNPISLFFSIFDQNWKVNVLSALSHDDKINLLHALCEFIDVTQEQRDYSSSPKYINDAIIAYSEEAKTHPKFLSYITTALLNKAKVATREQFTTKTRN